MVSRDTKLQIGLVSVVLVLSMLSQFVVPLGRLSSLAFFAGTYFLIFGGVHLYLALVGDGETIPVAARWRFVGLAAMIAVGFVLQETVGQTTVGGVTVVQLVGAVFAVTLVFYLVYEVRAGYLASRQ
ncbi:hypothetical protein NDI54_07125 [Haloarcula sp. S1AR25-5A]|uniref:Uncharacterized protein n=1 Tax=Haloarcula terrestris TaxID=2950533 RepID=A0AAE4EYK0_9EURY|nr:hypothetical protein [Haloarcula terrestris]MDS0221116.1 hypothetical protein [Haloarcula terrestris]